LAVDKEGKPVTWPFVLAVALGGAIGSVARYLVGIGTGKLFGLNFPWGTLIINIVGSMLIGAFAGLFAFKWDSPQAIRIFLTVGICGGFTTFSTFSLDTYYLIERGELAVAGFYIVGSVILSIAGLIGALHLIRVLS
jgi:CrcB protein